MLRTLKKKFQSSWLCAGDFNELVRGDEKLGGSRRSHNQMQLFCEAIDAGGFVDLGYMDSRFTWSKHYNLGHSIWERLDRALCITDWLNHFAGTNFVHLICNTLDHSPLWIAPSGIDPLPSSKPFRFEEMWLSNRGCGRVIEAVRRGSFPCEAERQVIRKIEKCGVELTQWSRKNFGHVRRQLIDKRKCLLQPEQQAMHGRSNNRVRGLKKEINVLLLKENLMWRQWAKTFWLVDGDKNSRYFHTRIT